MKRLHLIFLVAIGLVIACAIALIVVLSVTYSDDPLANEPDSLPSETVYSGPKLVNNNSPGKLNSDNWLVTVNWAATKRNQDAIDEIEKDLASMPDMEWNITKKYPDSGIIEMKCKESILSMAMDMPAMKNHALYVEPEISYNLTEIWNLDRIDQRALPLNNQNFVNSGATGKGVHVYILDTGILPGHQQFGGRANIVFSAINDGRNGVDCNGHGTHVAGTVGGSTYGVAKEASLHAIKVLGCDGSGTNTGVINGINWVTRNKIRPAIASMSLGGGVSAAVDQAVQASITSGVTYVVAAGNENTDACLGSPSRVPGAVTVGATGNNDQRASFSNFGTCVDIFAPGVNIPSAWYTSTTATRSISGTSMATPMVSGVAALFLQTNINASPAQVSAALVSGATPNAVADAKSANRLLYWPLNGAGGAGPAQNPVNTIPNAESGTITTVRTSSGYHPSGTFYKATKDGNHQATLVGPAGTDFDLFLYKFVENNWVQVGSSTGAGSQETINYSGTIGYYVFRIVSYAGTGNYQISFSYPAE